MKTRRSLAQKQAEGVDEKTQVIYIKFLLGDHHGSDSADGSRVGMGKTLVATGAMVAAVEKTVGAREILTSMLAFD